MLQGPLAYKVPEAGLGQPARIQVLSLGLPADTRLLGKTAQTLVKLLLYLLYKSLVKMRIVALIIALSC